MISVVTVPAQPAPIADLCAGPAIYSAGRT